MIGLLADGLFGYMIRSALAGPMAICALIATIAAICGCVKCARCRLRDCACCKRLLRISGHDSFDDFELTMLVHEAMFEHRHAKMSTVVRVTAGSHTVRTDPSSNGIFQQPLHLTVEQGAATITVDLMDAHNRILATLAFETVEDVLGQSVHIPERAYRMKEKGKGICNPKMKLTMAVQLEGDVEKGFLTGQTSDVNDLVRLQLAKARQEGKVGALGNHLSEMEVLKQACSGPLERFEGLGKTTNVYVSIIGPPVSRRWVIGIWADKKDFDAKKRATFEIDMLRIQSVQADPTRHHVFVLNYFDQSRVRQAVTFRRIDRARDVWVEILHLMVQKVRDNRLARRT